MCKQVIWLHRRLQPFLCETGLCVFVLRTVSTPETARSVLILWINFCWILCQIIAKSNLFVSFRFWVFSKEPIQESKWVPRLVSCVSATQSMPQNPAFWLALIPTPCSDLCFVSCAANEKHGQNALRKRLFWLGHPIFLHLHLFNLKLHRVEVALAGACGGWCWQQLSKGKIFAGVWTFRSASVNLFESNPNKLKHILPWLITCVINVESR